MGGQLSAKRFGRTAAYPLIRLLEPRFADVVRRLTDTRQAVHDEGALTRAAVAGWEARLQSLQDMLAGFAAANSETMSFVGAQLRDLTDEVRAPAPPAPAAVEQAFALRALARVDPPALVLDAGGAERQLAMQAAALGYDVIGADPRPYAHRHPSLEHQPVRLEHLGRDERLYDAVIALDGLAADGGGDRWEADARVLAHLRTRVRDGGLLVVALRAGDDGYDNRRLDALLGGWTLTEQIHVREHLPGTWVRSEEASGRALALIAATAA